MASQGPCQKYARPPLKLDALVSASFYPRHGSFVQVCLGDRGLGTFQQGEEGVDSEGQAMRSLSHTTLLAAGFHAARQAGQGKEKSFAFARTASSDNTRMTYWGRFVQFSRFNDALYTTYGYRRGVNMPNPSGRALRMLPLHCDNQQRIRQGRAPARNIELGDPGDVRQNMLRKGEDATLLHPAFLWLPALNLQALWESGGKTLTSEGMEWEDGSSKMDPPPAIMSLGFENVPHGSWGKAA